ncbi:amidohydrolase family protein [Microbispora sp. GKU 823]|uniref:amidohydrolase family protein n=1 Tax=Microbispora sp. GKU 823 TaxID=1652100 RepID=UPI002117F8ED
MSAIVITNAKVRTMDPGAPRGEALAVRDGRILAVGRDADVSAVAGPGAEVIDAGGRTVLPGFIDPHNHLLSTPSRWCPSTPATRPWGAPPTWWR